MRSESTTRTTREPVANLLRVVTPAPGQTSVQHGIPISLVEEGGIIEGFHTPPFVDYSKSAVATPLLD